jgi:hypothetical protein
VDFLLSAWQTAIDPFWKRGGIAKCRLSMPRHPSRPRRFRVRNAGRPRASNRLSRIRFQKWKGILLNARNAASRGPTH